VAVAEVAGYQNAGTVEFLVEDDGSFYFLEVNARLQVEHPVTELVTGLDLVRLQVEVALGERVDARPDLHGHAIECRLNAEDPAKDFLPGPGRITRLRFPAGPFVRIDAGVAEGDTIPGDYDSLFAKLLAWAPDREAARVRMIRALGELEVEGVPTTVPFSLWALDTLAFREGSHDTRWVERALAGGQFVAPQTEPTRAGPDGAAAAATVVVEVDGRRVPVRVWGDPVPTPPDAPAAASHHLAHAHGTIASPMQGTILKVMVEEGQEIQAGDVVCILEAMKMENHVAATLDGVVAEVAVSAGDVVQIGQTLVAIE
jgi:acetyl-CoA/propionyl-CoA carboxylase biotin carboxyl carrier protein